MKNLILLVSGIFLACSIWILKQAFALKNPPLQSTQPSSVQLQIPKELKTIPLTSPTSSSIYEAGSDEISLAHMFASIAPRTQKFIYLPSQPICITGEKGTEIHIEPHSFVYSHSSEEPNDEVQINLQEYYDPISIMAAGLVTKTAEKTLETAGMINLTANCEGRELALKSGTSIGLKFRGSGLKPNFMLFNGVYQPNSTNAMVWELADSSDYSEKIAEKVFTYYYCVDEDLFGKYGRKSKELFEKINPLGFKNPEFFYRTVGESKIGFEINENKKIHGFYCIKHLDDRLDGIALKVAKQLEKMFTGKQKEKTKAFKGSVRVVLFSTVNYPDFKDASGGFMGVCFEDVIDTASIKYLGSRDSWMPELKATQLGWFNCDRFPEEKNFVDLVIKYNQTCPTRAYAHVVDPNVYQMATVMGGRLHFSGIPVNKQVELTVFRMKNGQLELANQRFDPAKEKPELKFQVVDAKCLSCLNLFAGPLF